MVGTLELGAELAFERQPWIPISGSGSSVYWNGTRYRVDWWDGSANVDKNGALRESTSTAGPIDAPRSRTAWSGTTAMSVDVLSDPRLIQVWG